MHKNLFSKYLVAEIIFILVASAFVTDFSIQIATLDDHQLITEYQIDSLNRPLNQLGDIPWWNTDWLFRKEIIIDHEKVEDTLTNFPVLISLPSDANLSVHAQDDADDFVFTDKFGNRLNHEIELFNGITGELVAWVNVTNLSGTTDTTLFMYYGNDGASNQQIPEDVWGSNYIMVQHLNETGDTVYDSTLYENNGTSTGTTFNE